MITILSPAKRMEIKNNDSDFTIPAFLERTKDLIHILKSKTQADLQQLMKISPKLAELNFQRNMDFSMEHNQINSTQAIFAFKGDVYVGLEADTLSKENILFSNKHLKFLSGLYGILSPLDLVQPYRLEMGSKLINKKGKNLYEFWGNDITTYLNEAIKKSSSKYLINLASEEYYKVIDPNKIEGEIIKIVFKEYRDEKLKFITFNAKKARGMMARYIIKNKINSPKDLIGFDYRGYYYDEENSTKNEYWFIK